MSVNENDFKEIFEAISEISHFLNLADAGSLEVDQMKDLFKNVFYVEKLAEGLSSRGLADVFESALNAYLRKTGKIVPLNCHELKTWGDEVLKKILTIGEGVEFAAEEYLRVAGESRLKSVIERLSEARTLYLRLAGVGVLPEEEVVASLLAQSWLRLCDSGEEESVRTAALNMLADPSAAPPLLALLSLRSTSDILQLQTLLIDVISTHVIATPCSPTWIEILQSQQLVEIVKKFPCTFHLIKSTLSFLETHYEFDSNSNKWCPSSSCDVNYSTFLGIIKCLYSYQVTHFKLKTFMYSRKQKGHFHFWDHILSELATQSSESLRK